MLRHLRHRPSAPTLAERGAIAAEQIAVIVVVAAVIAAAFAIAVPQRVEAEGQAAVDCLFTVGCELPAGDDGGDAGGGPGEDGGDAGGGPDDDGSGDGGDGSGDGGDGGDGADDPGDDDAGDGAGDGGDGSGDGGADGAGDGSGDGPGDGPGDGGGDGPGDGGGDGPGDGSGDGGADGAGDGSGDGPGDGPGDGGGDGPGDGGGDGPGDGPGDGGGDGPGDDGGDGPGDDGGDDPTDPVDPPPGNDNDPGSGGGGDSSDPTSDDADPVNTLTGAFTERTIDLTIPGIGPSLWFGRSYATNAVTEGDLGRGWQHPFEMRVEVSGRTLTLVGESGQRTLYRRTADGIEPSIGARTELVEASDGFVARRQDGSILRFDADGRLTSVTDDLGHQLTIERRDGVIERAVGATGQSLDFTYTDGRLTEVRTADGRAVQLAYDDGLLAAVTDPAGATWRYGYDRAGRLVEVVDANGDLMVESVYDAEGRVVEQVEGGERTWALDYAVDGGVQVTTVTDPAGQEWQHRYRNGVLMTITDPLDHITKLGYDADLELVAMTDPTGATVRFAYDRAGRVTTVVPPAPFDVPERFAYDAAGRLLKHQAPDGGISRFVYSNRGDLVSATDPAGATTRFSYGGPAGAPTEVERPDGSRWTFRHDEHGRVVSERSPEGRGHDLVYDDAGNIVELVPTGVGESSWSFEWDDAGRITAVVDPSGSRAAYSYDGVGLLTGIEGHDGRTTSYRYDGAYALTGVTGPAGEETAYAYEGGRLVARTTATGAITEYGYDDAGRMTTVTSPTGDVWRYGHDAVGQVTRIEEPNGITTEMVLNGAGEIAEVVTTGQPDLSYEYDRAGRVVAMTDGLGRHTYDIDQLGRVIGISLDDEQTHAYTYDLVGNLTGRQVTGLRDVAFRYDADGAVTTVEGGFERVDQRHDAQGRVVEREHVSGAVTTYGYDQIGRVDRIHTRASDGSTADLHRYVYDAYGLPIRHLTVDQDTRYTYDDERRLVGAVVEARGTGEVLDELAWEYDELGRRTAIEDGDGRTTYSYDEADRLVSVDAPDGKTTFEYDASGNRVKAGDVEVDHGPFGRVDAVRWPGGSVDYVHDGSGVRRAAEHGDGGRSEYLWDLTAPNYPLLGIDGPESGGLEADEEYLTDPRGELLSRLGVGGRPQGAMHTDLLGSLTAITDGSGELVAAQGYDAFGRPVAQSGESVLEATSIGFTGELQDSATGLVHLRARDYDPAFGQFTALDPAGQAGSSPYISPYAYADNAPTLFTDPSGNCPFCVTALVGAAVGGVVGGVTQAVSNVVNDRPITEGLGGAVAGGALTGAVAGVAGPLGGTIARGLGHAASGAVSTAATTGINVVSGAVASDVTSLINTGQFASWGERGLGAGLGALGTGAGNLAGSRGLITTPHGMNTMRQAQHFAPRNIRNLFSDTRNWRALREGEAFGAAWGLGTGFIADQLSPTAKTG